MPDNIQIATLDAQIIDRIRAIGLPNLQSGTGVVPQATAFKVMQVTPRPASVEVVLTWIEPISVVNPVDHYIISVTGAVGNNRQPAAPYVVSKSPAKLSINLTPGLTGLTFQIQTVLKNGFVSPVETAPTCAAQVSPGNQENGVPSEVTSSTLSLTQTPTVIDTYVIPANFAKQGSIFRYTASGRYRMAFGAVNPQLTISAVVGTAGGSGADIGYVGAVPSNIYMNWRFIYEVCFRSIGSSATVAITSSLTSVETLRNPQSTGIFTVDSTQPLTVTVTVDDPATAGTNPLSAAGFTDFERYISYQENFRDARF